MQVYCIYMLQFDGDGDGDGDAAGLAHVWGEESIRHQDCEMSQGTLYPRIPELFGWRH